MGTVARPQATARRGVVLAPRVGYAARARAIRTRGAESERSSVVENYTMVEELSVTA